VWAIDQRLWRSFFTAFGKCGWHQYAAIFVLGGKFMRLGSKDDTKDNCSCHNPFFLHHRLAPIFLAAGLTEEEVQTGYVTEDATIPTSKGDALICTVLQSKVLKESEVSHENLSLRYQAE
jgi:putative SOS response-associated peptidase YedK